jgi:hypothetical protein
MLDHALFGHYGGVMVVSQHHGRGCTCSRAGDVRSWLCTQRSVAARLTLLGCTLVAALAAHSAVIYGLKGGIEELRWGLLQVWSEAASSTKRLLCHDD